MNNQTNNPDHGDQELSEPLRQAVDAVKGQPEPAGASDRAIAKARRLSKGPMSPRPWYRRYPTAVAVAALILIGMVLVWMTPPRNSDTGRGLFASRSTEGLLNERRVKEAIENSRIGFTVSGTQNPIPNDPGHFQKHGAPRQAVGNESLPDLGVIVISGTGADKSSGFGSIQSPPGSGGGFGERPIRLATDNIRVLPGGENPLDRKNLNPWRSQQPNGNGSLLFGNGVNSDEGLTGSIAINKYGPQSQSNALTHSDKADSDGQRGKLTKDSPTPAEPAINGKPTVEAEILLLQTDVTVDAIRLARFKSLSSTWGELPALDRDRALGEIKREMPEKYREAIDAYFNKLDKLSGKSPEVWHRDAAQPSLARVYVGDGNSLELVSLHVSVLVEGGRARTVVDHVFRNPHPKRLEGTFEYPLPTGASPAYFGMFSGETRDTVPPRFAGRPGETALTDTALAMLPPGEIVKRVNTADWGKLQEGKVVNQARAREVYEEIVRQRIDPALLEYAGGNTFRGRVFPIAPQGFNRVVFAYEETLPIVNEQILYRYPLPNRELKEMRFTLRANAADILKPQVQPAFAEPTKEGSQLVFTRLWQGGKAEGQVVFMATPAQARVQATSSRRADNEPYYVHARVRPELPEAKVDQPFARHAVFLLDTSLSEQPDRFGISMELLKNILEKDSSIEQFNVLTFNIGAAWALPNGWFTNDKAGRDKLFATLDGLVLEGATDLGAAFDKLNKLDVKPGTPLNVFLLSDANLTWGEGEIPALAAKFQQSANPRLLYCYRTGIGAENTELFEALTRNGGGIFQCYGRGDLAKVALAHRSHCLQVTSVRFEGGPVARDVLVAGRKAAVYPGGELILAGKFAEAGATKVIVEGTYRGEKIHQEFPVSIADTGELAPRAWGELAVAALIALNDPELDGLVTAYCQQFAIASKLTSFLVLESEADYKRFKLDEEAGKLKSDLGTYLSLAWATFTKPVTARQAFDRWLAKVGPKVKLNDEPSVQKLLALLKDADFELPTAEIAGALLYAKDYQPYLQARARDRGDLSVYIDEAERRAAPATGLVGFASCRALSRRIQVETMRCAWSAIACLIWPKQPMPCVSLPGCNSSGPLSHTATATWLVPLRRAADRLWPPCNMR